MDRSQMPGISNQLFSVHWLFVAGRSITDSATKVRTVILQHGI